MKASRAAEYCPLAAKLLTVRSSGRRSRPLRFLFRGIQNQQLQEGLGLGFHVHRCIAGLERLIVSRRIGRRRYCDRLLRPFRRG